MSDVQQQIADGARPLARVGDVIEHGQDIPANVVRLADAHDAVLDPPTAFWIRRAPGMYAWRGHSESRYLLSDSEPDWWPMTVVEVDPEPQPAEPVVEQCDECEGDGVNCFRHRVTDVDLTPEQQCAREDAHGGHRWGGAFGARWCDGYVGRAGVPQPAERTLIGPAHAHLDAPCTDACYEPVEADDVHYVIPEFGPSGATLCGIGIEEDGNLLTTGEAGKGTCKDCREAADDEDPRDELIRKVMAELGVEHPGEVLEALEKRFNALVMARRSREENRRERLRAEAEVQRLYARLNEATEALTELKPAESGPVVLSADRLEAVLAERAEAHEREVLAILKERDDAMEWADRLAQAVGEHFGVDVGEHSNANLPWQTALLALQFTPAPESGPVVLSLPQVPDGAVALIGGSSGATYPKVRAAWGFDQSETGVVALGELLDREDTVTVEFAPPREPRTWPKLDNSDDTLPNVVEVHDVRDADPSIWTWDNGRGLYGDDCGLWRSFTELRQLGEVREVLT